MKKLIHSLNDRITRQAINTIENTFRSNDHFRNIYRSFLVGILFMFISNLSYGQPCPGPHCTEIPDVAFEQKLIDLGIDDTLDGYILNAVAEGKTYLDVNSSSISDLSGIEAFVNLKYLYCYGNNLSDLDVSSNTILKLLFCSANMLTTLDVRANTALTSFHCNDNQLTSLDLRNGNNTILNNFIAVLNPDLLCISVDDPDWSEANWTSIDAGVTFATTNCGRTAVSDANFEQRLIDLNIDDMLDGYILNSAAEAETSIIVSSSSISDLSGIEAFVNLKYLNCYSNDLTELDVSKNTALQILNCDSNDLTELDVSQNTALKVLYCGTNALTELDVNQNTALQSLSCSSNALTELDVNQNTALQVLNCYSNDLTELDVNQNTALQYLACYSNDLTELDVSQNTALQTLFCYSNDLAALDLSQNTVLQRLYCYSNALTQLDLRNNGSNTDLVNFKATNNPDLECISVDDPINIPSSWEVDAGVVYDYYCNHTAIPDANFEQKLIGLNIDDTLDGYILNSAAEAVTSLYVNSSFISDLSGIEAFVNLQYLYCFSNDLTELDVSQNTALRTLSCYFNGLIELDVSHNAALRTLDCSINGLIELDVSQNTALQYLDCSSNGLIELDLSQNTALQILYCFFNDLAELDVSQNMALERLSCYSNGLIELDLSQNTALQILYCFSNDLAELDLSQNTFLQRLSCFSNALTDIDLRNNGSNTDITYFNASNNPNLECISVDDPINIPSWWQVDAGVVYDVDCAAALPVELVAFRGNVLDDQVKLMWTTASEINNAGFEVQRSHNGSDWEKIAFIDATPSTHSLTSYDYVDVAPHPGINYYRLKQVDIDGQYDYSDVLSFTIFDNKEIEIYPNPATYSVQITGAEGGQLSIIDHTGKTLMQKDIESTTIDISSLPNGIYIFQIQANDIVTNRKVVKSSF